MKTSNLFKMCLPYMKAMSAGLMAWAGLAGSAQAALYSQSFDVDDTANWTVNSGPGTNASNLFFDYSTVGIPSAPNSTGGTTRGVKLQANTSTATPLFGGISVSPTGQSFTGEFRMDFDFWLNFNGPAPVGGSGSTQAGGAGVGTAGNVAQWAGGTQDSIYFAMTLDGNSASDYRAYSPAAATSYLAASGVYAAGTGTSPDARNQSNPYYAGFAGQSAPAAQTLLFPQQTGTALTGSVAYGWHRGSILSSSGKVTFSIDGLLIATVNAGDDTVAGTNLLLTHFDTNGTASTDPNAGALMFSLFDNIEVTQVPEPTTMAFGLLSLYILGFRRRGA
jgi:hypothetical protein